MQSLHRVGSGCPDILAGVRFRNVLLEVKLGNAKANSLQVEWAQAWNGQVAIVRTPEEALIAVGAIK